MLHIDKNINFDDLKKAFLHNKITKYRDLFEYKNNNDKKEKTSIYTNIKEKLHNEQNGLCCYCCKKITNKDSSIEHIIPQNHPKDGECNSLNYLNLILSCNSYETCNHKRGSKYEKDRFVSPTDINCEEKFKFNVDTGYIYDVNNETNSPASDTINLLNLNQNALTNDRKKIIQKLKTELMVNKISLDYVRDYYIYKHQYADIVKYYYLNRLVIEK